MNPSGAVLVVGVALVDQRNNATAIVKEFDAATQWAVQHHWIALGRAPFAPEAPHVVVERIGGPAPKFALLNRALGQYALDAFAFVILCDDDVLLPGGFLDRYLSFVQRHDLALSQPARTHDSFIDHPFVEQLDGVDARRTRFVEIGPLVALRRDAVPLLVPFDESSPMGWGYDFAWPAVVDAHRLRMGIVDAVPVAHSLRKPLEHYDRTITDAQMSAYLSRHPHLTIEDACVILESYVDADE